MTRNPRPAREVTPRSITSPARRRPASAIARRLLTRGLLPLLLVGFAPRAARAQQDSTLDAQLRRALKHDWLSVGMLMQIVGDAQIDRTAPGHNGLTARNARLLLSGHLDGGVSYALQVNAVSTPILLDAKLGLRLGSWSTAEVGRMKVPFSGEQLASAAVLDFVNRARVVSALAPGRQVGAQLHGRTAGGVLDWAGGAFNGTTAAANDNEEFLYVGRLVLHAGGDPAATPAGRRFDVGASFGRSRDAAVAFGGLIPSFAGTRTLLGADARWQRGRLLLDGEVLTATLDSLGAGTHRPRGWQATAGWHLAPHTQVLARWDAMRPDGLGPDADALVLGFNRWPTALTKIQVNWLVDLRHAAPKRHQLLVNLQVAF